MSFGWRKISCTPMARENYDTRLDRASAFRNVAKTRQKGRREKRLVHQAGRASRMPRTHRQPCANSTAARLYAGKTVTRSTRKRMHDRPDDRSCFGWCHRKLGDQIELLRVYNLAPADTCVVLGGRVVPSGRLTPLSIM